MPVVAIVLEEAQRVLSSSRDRESNVFPRVAREGRKFKVGLCAITQQPKLLDDELPDVAAALSRLSAPQAAEAG